MDLEAYDRRSAACRQAVLRFLDSWSRGIRALAYTSGVYSSVGSGIRDLGRGRRHQQADGHLVRALGPQGRSVRPTAYMGDEWWPGHHRIKQYRGDHMEKHGGIRLKIDSDAVDGDVG